MTIKYILFDCGNTLVHSEELAFEATATVVNEFLTTSNVVQRYSAEDLKNAFLDRPFFRGIANRLQRQHHFRLSYYEVTELSEMEEDLVIAKLNEKAEPCVGAKQVLAQLHQENKYKLAVVSTTASMRRLQASLTATDLSQFIDSGEVYSAWALMSDPATKAESAVYRHVLAKYKAIYGAKPHEFMVIQDTAAGAQAAVRAKLPVMGYVGAYRTSEEKHEAISRLITAGCMSIMWHWDDFDKEFEQLQEQIEE